MQWGWTRVPEKTLIFKSNIQSCVIIFSDQGVQQLSFCDSVFCGATILQKSQAYPRLRHNNYRDLTWHKHLFVSTIEIHLFRPCTHLYSCTQHEVEFIQRWRQRRARICMCHLLPVKLSVHGPVDVHIHRQCKYKMKIQDANLTG